jgi:PAS domain S-box-containing protein
MKGTRKGEASGKKGDRRRNAGRTLGMKALRAGAAGATMFPNSLENLYSLLNAIGDPIFVKDSRYRLVYVNDAECELTGHARREVIGRTDYDFFPKRQVDVFLKRDEDVLRTGRENLNEEEITDSRGLKHTILTKKSRYVDQSGNRFIVGVMRDITERKLMEEGAKASEERFEGMFKGSKAVMLIIEPKTGAVVDANEAACRFYGYSQKRMTSMRMAQINTLPRSQIQKEMRLAVSEKRSHFYFKHRLAGGQVRDVEVHSSPVRIGDRTLLYSIVHDVTDRRQVEAALAGSEEKYRRLVEDIYDAIYSLDLSGRITYISPASKAIIGYRPEELVGRHFSEFIYPEDLPPLRKSFKDILRGEHYPSEYRVCGKAGDIRWVRSYSRGITEGGRIRSIRGLLSDITDRKLAEDSLRATQQRQQALLDNIPDLAWLKDSEGRFTAVNEPFARSCGFKPKDLIGKSDLDVWPKRLALKYMADDRKVMKGRQRKVIEEPLADKGGGEKTIETIKTPVFGQEGKVIGTVGIARDITERKLAESAIEDAKEYLDKIINSVADPIFVKDERHRWVLLNDAYCEFMGYSKHELIGRSDPDFFPPQEAKVFWKKDNEVFRTGGENVNEEYFTDATGFRHTILTRKAVYTDKSGRKFIVGVIRDVTELKENENRIRENEEFLDKVMNTIGDPVFVKDDKSVFVLVNDALCDILGLGREDILGRTLAEKLPKDQMDHFFEVDRMVLATGEENLCEEKLTGKGGIILTILTRKTRYTDKAGKNYVVGVIRDISERMRMEEALRKARDELEDRVIERTRELSRRNEELKVEVAERKKGEERIKASLKEKEVLIKEIHHRVKNNLQLISSLLNLQAKYVKDPRDLEVFNDSQNRVRSMAFIHERLYQSGDLARIDFKEYLQSLTDYLFRSYSADPDSIRLGVSVEDVQLPVNSVIACGLIVNELVSNSLKYAFPGGRRGSISIGMHPGAGTIVLTVSDDGVGLPDGLDFRKTESLGLQLVTALVEQLDGHMDVDRSGGVRFVITFPSSPNAGGGA